MKDTAILVTRARIDPKQLVLRARPRHPATRQEKLTA